MSQASMSHCLHSNARTTPKTRAEISESTLSKRELMVRYSISQATVTKWQERADFEDRSHRPHELGVLSQNRRKFQNPTFLTVPTAFDHLAVAHHLGQDADKGFVA